jgi:MYXO-CTERM domain-containing protein
MDCTGVGDAFGLLTGGQMSAAGLIVLDASGNTSKLMLLPEQDDGTFSCSLAEAMQLTPKGDAVRNFDVSPDGNTVVYERGEYTYSQFEHTALYTVPADGSAEATLILEPDGATNTHPRWAENGMQVYYTRLERDPITAADGGPLPVDAGVEPLPQSASVQVINADGTRPRATETRDGVNETEDALETLTTVGLCSFQNGPSAPTGIAGLLAALGLALGLRRRKQS